MERRAFLAAACLALFAPNARAGMAKPYRLALWITGFDAATRTYDGGLEIELDKGWKTYWRMPGDAGIPPQFNWAGSTNVKEVEILWPAPHRFMDVGGETVGYKDRVVFPLRIYPEIPDAEVKLKLSLFFGVCEDICIPASGELSAVSGQANPAAAALIASYKAKVPRIVDAASSFKVTKATLGNSALILTVEGEASASDIFVEGVDFAYFKAPRRDGSTYVIPFTTQGDPERVRGKTLKLTMIGPDIALEQHVTVE